MYSDIPWAFLGDFKDLIRNNLWVALEPLAKCNQIKTRSPKLMEDSFIDLFIVVGLRVFYDPKV